MADAPPAAAAPPAPAEPTFPGRRATHAGDPIEEAGPTAARPRHGRRAARSTGPLPAGAPPGPSAPAEPTFPGRPATHATDPLDVPPPSAGPDELAETARRTHAAHDVRAAPSPEADLAPPGPRVPQQADPLFRDELFRDELPREEPAPPPRQAVEENQSWFQLRRRRPPKSRAKARESSSMLATAIVLSSLGAGIVLVGLTATQIADGKVGSLSAAAVVGVLTAVFVHRALGTRWGTAASAGVITGVAVLSHIPEVAWPPWWPQMLAGFSIAIAGSVAILLTLPVRRLTGLPGEYAVAVLVATSGGGAATMCLRGEALEPTTAGISIVAGLALALMGASGARTKLAEERPTVGAVMYEWAFLFGVLIAAGALAVILILRGSSFAGEWIGGLRPLIVVPLAALGPGVVARAWTPNAWWACAGASLGASGVAIAVVGMASGEGFPTGLSIAWSAILAALIGLALTVVIALSVNRMMHSTNPRAKRPVRRTIAEPGRLSIIV